MDIEVWDGGLQEQEIEAINKIKVAFTDDCPVGKLQGGSSSLRDQLQNKFGRSGMFPWKGYAGFRFVGAKGKEGEFDIVIVTHCNVIIVELKDWNREPITASGDVWFKGDRNMGRSPVSVTRNKKFLLENKLKRFSSRFSNKKHLPRVYFFVVMTGDSDFSQLPEVDLQHTISLKEFLRFADKGRFNSYFRPHPESQVLNKDIPVFDELFQNGNTAPKALRIGGYTAVEEVFEHPKYVYKEYLASSEISKGTEALLRVWNFKMVQGNKAFTPQGRAEIVSREREVLQFINHQNRDLYNHCLRSLTSFEKDEVTSQCSEVYELPPGHVRFNEFVGKYGQSLSQIDRLNLTKLLLAKFGDLHEIKIAHRDIADHSLWLSPSKEIALSSFISAYHQRIGTVGDYRDSLSVGAVEVKHMLDQSSLTPFQQDVHALGIVSWHLLTAQRMSPKSLDNIQSEMLSSGEWYADVLLDAVGAKFKDASIFFDSLKCAEPKGESIPTFDDSELIAYRRPINHLRQFRDEGDFLVSTDDKEVYLSEGRLVKAWLNVGSEGDEPVRNFRVLSFLKRLDKLAAVNPTYLPRILDYGLAARSNSMYLVTDLVDGKTWADAVINASDKVVVIERLIGAVEHLHGLGLAHGDLHPANVMLGSEDGSVFLIDIPDFSHNTDEVRNHRYSPENIDGSSPVQRDIFAVLRMSCELLGLEWGGESEDYPRVADAILAELNDIEFGFKDLGRFKKALNSAAEAQGARSVEIALNNIDEQITILPDNGHLYVKVEASKKGECTLLVTFAGIGGAFSAFYDKAKRCFIGGLPPRIRSEVNFKVAEESQFEICTAIRIKPGRPAQFAELSEHLRDNDAFHRAIEMLQTAKPEIDESRVSQQLKDVFERAEGSDGGARSEILFDISTQALWRAILATETESSPNIELNGAALTPSDDNSELILPYESDIDPLGAFVSTDDVEALLIDADGAEKVIGEVSLKKSALNEVRLNKVRFSAYGLKDGDSVFFRTKQDRASYRKRKAALERLLDREGVLPELLDLFDPACKKDATPFNVAVTDDDFARYDREDQYGNRISLNQQQREAFTKLLNYGPLSLLQGPPGTGKTEFIAAFVHFLIEKLDVRRILLVSQSHEAVNTAAERIRKHCGRLGTSLEVVRFSNREGAVSHGLKDVYSHAITTERRELFNAEYRYRVVALADALGLDSEFISKVVDAELKIFKQIDHLESLLKSFDNISDKDDIKALKPIVIELDDTIRSKLHTEYSIALPEGSMLSEAKTILLSKLCSEFGVRPNEARRVRALARISRDIQDALSAERVNCDEFYARSRQLVTGTCVGIGQGHIGIHDNIYDFVIIDEAARSISSELAIAMQSAKRVLLVGDHLQLPPLYSDAHKAALARRLGINDKNIELDEVLRSDFARAFNSEYGKQASATLLTQYRMAPPIGNLVSKTFYDGKLNNGPRAIPNIYQDAPNLLRSPVTWLDTSSLGDRANHQSDRGVSIYNRCEAEQVIELLKQISESGQFLSELSSLKDKDDALIGVICMYAEQKRLIRQKFNQGIWSDGFKELVKIDTVDSYQGKENRIIILSLTRSDKSRSPGFLRTPNRINVAMSRAMDRLLIIGNADMWKTHNKDKPLGQVVSYMSDMGEDVGYKFMPAQNGR
ncbi:AAA domain-containing protein [Ectopseudomonas oleovorans]|uniref:AAA domain-containing protein n=1 Tax=Ectopseudomonas oleovorans TaxID=301 RepID=A0AA42TYN0_ECTOL|nr:AAA domain-containing protein [Pseudomonas oleovorans]MDH1341116.1 AAA domain-containing protein [Pseudomonas oleovorans]MDH1494222.1 AAA domain-containing protein [Pseudomonas oleovorans]WGG22931.1 AAA domain-containing protein [Pseudomonas oleovorans]